MIKCLGIRWSSGADSRASFVYLVRSMHAVSLWSSMIFRIDKLVRMELNLFLTTRLRNVAVAWADWQCVWYMGLKDTPELAANPMVVLPQEERERAVGWAVCELQGAYA